MVNWRSTVTDYLAARAHETLNSPSASLSADLRFQCAAVSWPAFAQAWRDSYMMFTRSHDPASTFISVDKHHHDSLVQLLKESNISELWRDGEVEEISKIWHYLDGWPDSSKGIKQLNQEGFQACTLSNGNVQLLEDMAKHADLQWKHIFSGEQFKTYKPSPQVYYGAAEKLGLPTNECAMVAAHLGDLQAAKGCGYQTIYIERALEESWTLEATRAAKREGWVDMWVPLDERFDGGGIAEISRKFERGKPL